MREIKKKEPAYIATFRDGFYKSMEGMQTACEGMVRAIDEDPARKDEFVSAFPEIAGHTWRQLEAVGRGIVDLRLALGGGGTNGAKIKRLPISDQRRILDGDTVPLLLEGGDSINVDATACSKEQAEQLFDRGQVRTLPQQRAFMEARKVKDLQVIDRIRNHRKCWRIADGQVVVSNGVLTKEDIKQIMAEVL